jgi:hypothetical protein
MIKVSMKLVDKQNFLRGLLQSCLIYGGTLFTHRKYNDGSNIEKKFS